MAVNQMVLDQLQTDPDFAVDFIIDNNPAQVQSNLSGLNLLSGLPQDTTLNTLRTDVRAIDDEETFREVLSVPYENEVSNYTGGYSNALNIAPHTKSGDENEPADNKAGWGVGLVNGIFNVGSAYFNWQTSQEQTEAASAYADAAYIEAQRELELERMRLQQEEGNKILGVPPTVFIVIVASVAMIILIAILKK
jgi:hypothetical protein